MSMLPGGARQDASPVNRCTDLPLREFVERYWGKAPLVAKASQASEGWNDLLSADDVDGILSCGSLRAHYLRIVKQGAAVDPGRYTRVGNIGDEVRVDLVDPEAVARHWDSGASLVLRTLHKTWPPLTTFAAQMARELGAGATATAYVTPPASQAIPAHYDTHDVFVLQVTGSKRWIIHDPVVELPGSRQQGHDVSAAIAAPPRLDVVLEAGDCLYLPRGYVHAPATNDDHSIHVTIGVQPVTWADVLQDFVADFIADIPAFRTAVTPGSSATASASQELEALLRQLGQRLVTIGEVDGAGSIARSVQRAVLHEPPTVLGRRSHAHSLDADTLVRLRRGLSPTVTSSPTGSLSLTASGRTITVPGAFLPHLNDILGQPATPRELAQRHPGATAQETTALLARLVLNGILVASGR